MRSYLNPSFDEEALELTAQAILTNRRLISAPNADRVDVISDEDWLKQSFMIDPETSVDSINIVLRTFSNAEFKYQDSSLGGNHEINPRPQFTRYADMRVRGRLDYKDDVKINSPDGNHGIGHFYSEAIDDSSQVIHMRFGVPQFNSLTTFFAGFFSYKAARVARTGRADPSIFYSAGNVIGLVSLFIAWPLLLVSIGVSAIKFLLNKPSTSFYSLKPTMPVYWYAVNTMVNQIAVNRGMYPGEMKEMEAATPGDYYKIDTGSMSRLSQLMPDIFSESGGIDVYAAANRAQRIKNRLDYVLAETLKGTGPETFKGYIDRYETDAKEAVTKVAGQRKNGIADAINSWFQTEVGKVNDDGTKETYASEEYALKLDKDGKPTNNLDKLTDHIKAEFDDGSQFASFRVDSTGSVSESFSNSFVENDLASKFNSISSGNKSSHFAFAGYNVTGLLEPAFNAIKDVAGGALEAVSMSGLLALNGSAFVDIPKNWESSSVNFPKSNYTMTLISPYGNPISQMTNIYIPLCMLLAGALPIQTGKHSYTSPFILEMYDRGRQQTRLGMIDSLSIQRGTSNLAFNKEGNAMAIEVSFSVADLSTVLAMPVVQRSIFDEGNIFESLFSDDNTFTDYMNTLSSLTLSQQVYKFSTLQLRWAQKQRRISQIFSPARIAGLVHASPVGMLDVFFTGTDRL